MTLPATLFVAAPDPAAPDDPLLDDAERARCAHYRRREDRARHATARVLAKRAAAAVCGAPATAVRVVPDVAPHLGRPLLVVPGLPKPPHLSIAHAGTVVLVALASVPVGVDVERVDAVAEVLDSPVVFGPGERAALERVDPARRAGLACTWWTAKEAAVKAVGCGFLADAAGLDARGDEVAVTVDGHTHHAHLHGLAAPTGYRATLALLTAP